MPPDLSDLHPLYGLRVEAGPLELRGITDELLVELCEMAVQGIHDPAHMPFSTAWTDVPPEELVRKLAAYHWRSRADFSVQSWDLHLAVLHEGRVVGTQALETTDYLITRTGETGSWLGLDHQGKGIGTAMRQAICALAFDHLEAAEITSGAFLESHASLGVSRKLGYRPNGVRRVARRGAAALNQRLVLTPETFVRGEHRVRVEGLEPLRRAIGLDA